MLMFCQRMDLSIPGSSCRVDIKYQYIGNNNTYTGSHRVAFTGTQENSLITI